MNVELLYQTIKEDICKYQQLVDMYGKDNAVAKKYSSYIFGMQHAFKLITGISYTEYLLSKLS